MNRKTLSIWHDKEKSWIEESELPEAEASQVFIQSKYSLISSGTERTMITQSLPRDTADRMRVPYMQGSLMDTFTYGYSLVGEVISGNETLLGKNVHTMHPHQSHCIVNAQDVFEFEEPLDPKTACFASHLETIVNALWDARIEPGDRVLILGYGLIGALLATVIRSYPGVEYAVSEIDPEKMQLISNHGHSTGDEIEYDVVFNTTGTEAALQEAIERTREEGKVIEMSWFGSRETHLKLGGSFHYGRKTIQSSQVSQIPLRKRSLWNHSKRKELVFTLLRSLDFSHLITTVIDFEKAPEYYNQLRKGQTHELGILISYS